MEARRPMVSGAIGAIGVFAMLAWQFLTVHYNYGGDWTALFHIREGMPVPEFLKSEHVYIFENSQGYDGQVYHLIAHDPWMRKGSADAIADAPLRYQRIFVPALAWMIALGQDSRIHAGYFNVILAFVFLGVYWMSQYAMRMGRAPTWGLMFLLAPATMVSIDRMTVDIALAALAVGFALYAGESFGRVLTILTCAVLTRETALPIMVGYTVYVATRRQFGRAILAASTILPAAGWHFYIAHQLANRAPSTLPDYVGWIPLSGFVERILHPAVYSISPFKNAAATFFDYAALAGVAMTLALAARFAIKRRWDACACAIYALAIAAMFIGSRSVWEDVNAFGRVLTPLLLLIVIAEWRVSRWAALAPVLLIDARIALDLAAQIRGVTLGMIGPLLK